MPIGHNYGFYLAEKKKKLCKIIKRGDVEVSRKCVFLRHGNKHHEGGGLKGKHGLQN